MPKRPLPISNTGLRRTRGGQAANPAQAAAPALDPQVKKALDELGENIKQLAQQPIKPIARPIASPLSPLD